MKLILKIALVGAFFCGTAGQASSHQTLLSFDNFMSLNKAQKVAYIRTLRDALARGEKAQYKKGMKYQAQYQVPRFPNFQNLFFSEALAAADSPYCIYAGNISNRKLWNSDATSDYCHILTGGPCTNPAYPSQCNIFLFGVNVCVAVPTNQYNANDATKACEDKVLRNKVPGGYKDKSQEEIDAIDKKIIEDIGNNDANRKAWKEFGDNLAGYCGQTDRKAWKNLHQEDLCNRIMSRYNQMKDALNKNLVDVPAEKPHADVAADLPINGGCDYTVDLKNTYHIDYSLDHGKFRPINHAPPFELFSDSATSDNCEDGKTIPNSCNLYIAKNTAYKEGYITQHFKLTGANATGGSGGTTTCTVEKIDADVPDSDVREDDDIIDCNKADIGKKTQLFCVGQHEGIFKAVIFVEHGPHGQNGVRVCEAPGPSGDHLNKWYANKDSTSTMDTKINGTSLTMAKNHGEWWKLGLGRKTLSMTFDDGTEQTITRHKPTGGEKMIDGVQECDFSDEFVAGKKDPNGKSIYFHATNLYTKDGKGNFDGQSRGQ